MFGHCLGLLDYSEILVRVLWALVCHVLQDQILFLPFESSVLDRYNRA